MHIYEEVLYMETKENEPKKNGTKTVLVTGGTGLNDI